MNRLLNLSRFPLTTQLHTDDMLSLVFVKKAPLQRYIIPWVIFHYVHCYITQEYRWP